MQVTCFLFCPEATKTLVDDLLVGKMRSPCSLTKMGIGDMSFMSSFYFLTEIFNRLIVLY